MPLPIDKKLYEKVKKEAKKKFTVWPSIYASSWLVREYKKRGGRYKGKRDDTRGLQRWYDEEWVDVCYWPRKKSCGRKTAKSPRKYPYCRPSKRINKKTPKTVQELTASQRKKRCSKKRRKPSQRVG